jgi:hypothetical protein
MKAIPVLNIPLAAGTILLLLSACQQAERSATAPESQSVDAARPAAVPSKGEAPEGRPATPEEIARFLAERKDGSVVLPQSAPAPLAKASAVPGPSCMVNFNSSSSISYMSDQAWSTFTSPPHYIHDCTSGWIYTNPIGTGHFHLNFAHLNTCQGAPYKVGYRQANGSCLNQQDARLYPRTATNMGANTAIQFFAQNSARVRKNFDLKSIRVISGPIQIVGYRTDVGWWQWSPLTPGTWTFYNANNLSEMTVYHNDRVNTYEVDDINVAVQY